MKQYCYNCMEELDASGVCKNCSKSADIKHVPHHLAPGTILNNKYIVGKALGEGGFGITYVGRDQLLDIKVAIKEFYPNGYANRNSTVSQEIVTTTDKQKNFFEKGKERFLQEARNIAKFNQEKGIVDIHDYFEQNGTAYIMMEYLDGMTLSDYCAKFGNFNPENLFTLLIPLMESLKKIHDAGIIHRDISPDNIMYLKNGTLKLMDFGSARYFQNQENTLSVVLKMGFAPLEQYNKNGEQGPWTDVYGLCATIYKCITGKIPDEAIDRLTVDNLKPPSQLGIQINPQLERILMQGLALNHNDRIKNMDTLITFTKKALQSAVYQPQNIPQQQSVVQQPQQPPKQVIEQKAPEKYVAPQNYDNMKTQYADEPITTQGVNTSPAPVAPHPTQKTPVQNHQPLPENQNKTDKKSQKKKVGCIIAAIVVPIVLLIIIIIVVAILGINHISQNIKEEATEGPLECAEFDCESNIAGSKTDYCILHSAMCEECLDYINPDQTLCDSCSLNSSDYDICLEPGCSNPAVSTGESFYCYEHSNTCSVCWKYINPYMDVCSDCDFSDSSYSGSETCKESGCSNTVADENTSYCYLHSDYCKGCIAYIDPGKDLCDKCKDSVKGEECFICGEPADTVILGLYECDDCASQYEE